MRSLLTLTLTGLLLSSTSALAEPSNLIDLGDLPGGAPVTFSEGISNDGLVPIGRSSSINGIEAYYWTSGTGIVGISDFPGGLYTSIALGVNGDGSVIVGEGYTASGATAFRWTSGTGLVSLGDFAGGITSSRSFAVNNDGTVVVGYGYVASGQQAFRWTSGSGLVGLGELPGGIYLSSASDVSGDGSIVIGKSFSANGSEAFRWTSGTGMVGLGDLPGGSFSSSASGISSDGTVIVGSGTSASGSEAFRWTSGTGMVGLGDLAGGSFNSSAKAVNADGTVIVGFGTNASGSVAMIWDQANGMRDLESVLSGLGVDLTGWVLKSSEGVSDNGERIVGEATYSGNFVAFLAIVSDSLVGLTTVDGLAESLSEARVVHQQATSQMGVYNSRGLFLARNAMSYFPKAVAPQKVRVSPSDIEPAAGEESVMGSGYFSPEKWAFYSLGSFAMGQENNPDSHAVDGSVGALYRADKNWIVGGGMISGQSSIDLGNGGTNILESYGGEILSSYQHPSGVRLYLIGFASYLTLDSSRGYMNGGGRSYSYGESEGYGYGGSARLGYEMDVLPERGFTATPYIEAEYSKTHLDHYAEDQGPFPANYSDQSGERVIGRVGVELSHDVGETVTVRGRAAYARRLHDAENDVTASSTGLTMTLTPNAVDDQWAEGGVSVLWQADENMHLFADLSGRTGKTEDPYARATVGLTMGF